MSNYPYPELPRYEVDALGIHTSYYAVGEPNGRPVILLHGMSTSADSFRETMHELADDFWLIAPDIPGFGYSEQAKRFSFPHLVEWLAALYVALDLPPAALLGHSFGGALAATFAADYPEDVTRLLLAAPALLASESYPAVAKKVGISLGLIDLGSAVSQSRVWVKRQVKSPFHDPARQDKSVWARRLRDYELARASADVIKVMAQHHLRPLLPQIEQPVCLVWGEQDPVVPPADADTLQEILPRAHAHLLPNCGHAPMLEQQPAFQAIARSFLQGAPGHTLQ